MSTYKKFKNSDKLETEGVWLDYGDFKIRVARAGGSNKAYEKLLEKRSRRFRRALETDTATDEMLRPVIIKVFAESVVLGWEGVTDENEAELPFTVENCVKLFTDLPDLYQDVRAQAGKGVLFRKANLEGDSKN